MTDKNEMTLKDAQSLITKLKPQLSLALPNGMTAERLARIALTELRATPKLQQCSQESFMRCLMVAAQYGLEPGTSLGHVYFIPYGKECQMIIGYKGMLNLARRSGEISCIEARAVYENDSCSVRYGVNASIEHSIDPANPNRGKPIGYYAVVTFKDGSKQFEFMHKAEVDKIRSFSKSGQSPAWINHYDEMAKKGLSIDTNIPTTNGWKKMLDLQVGDQIFDMHGEPTSVTAISEIKHLPCFKLTFTNGESIICDDEHKWVARIGASNACRLKYEVKTINEMHDALEDGLSVTIPLQGKLHLPDANLPLDPYLLGYWLGNGNSHSASISVGKEDLNFMKQIIMQSQYKIGNISHQRSIYGEGYLIGIISGFRIALKKLNLICNKHIPNIYFRASIRQRRALLQGLLDSDGHIDKSRGRAHFYNNNILLSNGVAELAYSLGEHVHRKTKRQFGFNTSCITHAVFWKPSFLCVRNPRKAQNYQCRKIKLYRSIKSIEKIPTVPTKCISVDSPSKTYLAGELMAVTHNTVTKRLLKYIPSSIEMQRAAHLDDLSDSGRQKDLIDAEFFSVDTETGEIISNEQKSQAEELAESIK